MKKHMAINELAQGCAIIFLLFTQTVFAEIYKWVDEQGEVHYSQQKPESQGAKEVNITPQPLLSGDGLSTDTSSSGARGLAQQCDGHESIRSGATVYCCTASCVSDMRNKKQSFSCATQKCYERLIESDAALRKEKEAKEQKDKREKEAALERAEAVRNAQRFKEEQRQIEIERQAERARRRNGY